MCHWYDHCKLAKRIFELYPNGSLEISYEDKNAKLSDHMPDKAVWGAEELINKGDEPATQWEYDELLREAALSYNDAARAAGHTIRSCDFCQHYERQGEKLRCMKHNTPVPWYAAVQCEDFLQPIYLPDEEIE